jgi:aryl-alcohol dehydrogenase-like predicted oxidoreductase
MGVTPGQVALNWVRQQKGSFIPIVGARKESQIKDSLDCLNFTIPEKMMNRLNDVSKIELGFPHDFLEQPFVRDLVYSGKYIDIIK